MFARIAKKNKTAFLILLAITILLSFLCWDDEKVQGTRFGATEEVSFLIEKPSEDVKIQIVDEINSVVFHAVIIRRISST